MFLIGVKTVLIVLLILSRPLDPVSKWKLRANPIILKKLISFMTILGTALRVSHITIILNSPNSLQLLRISGVDRSLENKKRLAFS